MLSFVSVFNGSFAGFLGGIKGDERYWEIL
jgi:hypothetical protein